MAPIIIIYIGKDTSLLIRSEKVRITYQEMSSLPEGVRTPGRRKVRPARRRRAHWRAALGVYGRNSQVVLLLYNTKIIHLIFEVIWYIQCTSSISLEEGFHNTLSMTIWHLEKPDIIIQVEPHPGKGGFEALKPCGGASEARQRARRRSPSPAAPPTYCQPL